MKSRSILEGYPSGVLLLGEVFEECNEQACLLLQAQRDGILGYSLLDFSPTSQPDGRNSASAAQQYIEAAFSGSPQIFQWQACRKDAILIDLEISLKAIELEDRKLLLLSMFDCRERRQLEEKLRESQNRYKILTEVSPVGIFHTNYEGKFLYVNDRWCEITGFLRKEALEKGLTWGIYPDDRKKVLQEWCDVAEQDRPFQSEYRIVHTDGRIFWVYGQMVAEKGENGEVMGYLGMITDITDRKKIEEVLEERNEFIEAIIGSLPIGLVVLSYGDLKPRFVNAKFGEIVGWQRNEWSDLDAFLEKAIPDPVIRQQIRNKMFADLKSGVLDRMNWEFSISRPAGEMIDLQVSAIPMWEQNKVIFAFQDITAQKQTEKALCERNEFIETITDNLPIGFAVISLENDKILYENKKMEEILGWPREITKNVDLFREHAFPDPVFRNEMKTRYEADLASGDPTRLVSEYPIVKMSGETAEILVVTIPMFDRKLRIVAIQDITERKLAQEEILKLNQTLEARVVERTRELDLANKEMEAFTYSVSHDLRAPLRAIDGFSEALLDEYEDKLDEEGKTFLRYLQEGSRDMSELIDGLLKLSRSTRGEMVREPVDLSSLAATVVAELDRAEPERQVAVHIAQNLKADADPRLLKVVLENLLGNAWKYTARTADASIAFGAEQQDGETVFLVRDNGAGFDMAYANKLFLPFQRLHKSGEFPGTGIGLATVQRIINRHGGRIWGEGAVGKGASFYFTLEPEGNPHE